MGASFLSDCNITTCSVWCQCHLSLSEHLRQISAHPAGGCLTGTTYHFPHLMRDPEPKDRCHRRRNRPNMTDEIRHMTHSPRSDEKPGADGWRGPEPTKSTVSFSTHSPICPNHLTFPLLGPTACRVIGHTEFDGAPSSESVLIKVRRLSLIHI